MLESTYFDSFTLIVIFGGAVVVVIGLALRQIESMKKNIPAWLVMGLLGILVGGGASMVAMHGVGYHWKEQAVLGGRTSGGAGQQGPMEAAGGGGMMGGGMMGGGGGGGGAMQSIGPAMSGMMGGAGGGGMMGGGGSGGPPARATLPSLVGKLDLVIHGLSLKLDDDKIAKLAEAIKNLDDEDEMSEDAAKEHLDAINDLLTDEQQEVLASFSLPFARRGGGGAGGRGGGGGGPAAQPGGMGGAGGGQASSDNPFKQDDNAKRLRSLRERIGEPVAVSKSESEPEESKK